VERPGAPGPACFRHWYPQWFLGRFLSRCWRPYWVVSRLARGVRAGHRPVPICAPVGIRTPNLLIRRLGGVVSGGLGKAFYACETAIRQLSSLVWSCPVAVSVAVIFERQQWPPGLGESRQAEEFPSHVEVPRECHVDASDNRSPEALGRVYRSIQQAHFAFEVNHCGFNVVDLRACRKILVAGASWSANTWTTGRALIPGGSWPTRRTCLQERIPEHGEGRSRPAEPAHKREQTGQEDRSDLHVLDSRAADLQPLRKSGGHRLVRVAGVASAAADRRLPNVRLIHRCEFGRGAATSRCGPLNLKLQNNTALTRERRLPGCHAFRRAILGR